MSIARRLGRLPLGACRIELERTMCDSHVVTAFERGECLLESPLAEVTPGAHDVGPDVYLHRYQSSSSRLIGFRAASRADYRARNNDRVSRYLARRLLLTIPVLLGVATLVFALIHFIPGDPARAILGDVASEADIAQLRKQLGLDRPLAVQYVAFLDGLIRADLGTSLRTGTPGRRARFVERLPATFELALAAMVVALVLAIPLGIAAAVWRGTLVDHTAMTMSLAGVSMPNFWLGPLLAIVFGVELGWLPVSGRGGLGAPGPSCGFPRCAALAAVLARMTRATLADQLRRAVRAGRARTWRLARPGRPASRISATA